MSNGLLFRMLRPMINPSNYVSNSISYFIGTIIQKACTSHFSVTNSVYNFANNYFSDSVIVILSPFIYLFALVIPPIVNFWYIIIQWFSNINLLDKIKAKKGFANDGSKQWKNASGFFNYGTYIFTRLISIILLFTGIIPLFATLLTFVLTLMFSIIPYTNFIKSQYKNNPDKKYGVYSTFKDLLLNKMWLIAYIISYFILSDISETFGLYPALIGFVVCILFWAFTTLYKSGIPSAIKHSH